MELIVKGMHCKSCVMLITDALEENGIKKVKISLDEKKQIGKVSFEGDKEKAIKLIEAEGYHLI
ncbi:MAG: heavy metal-associated domain-containing protein [Candidatus Nanoarchaeia archaeon]